MPARDRPWRSTEPPRDAHLMPLPSEIFECPLWKKCTVHPDHHIVFDGSCYSLPTRFIGQQVWARGGRPLVRIYLNEELIKTYERATHPGTWQTHTSAYPPEKLDYLMPAPTHCRSKAAQIGPQTESFIRQILGDHAMRNLRKAQALMQVSNQAPPSVTP